MFFDLLSVMLFKGPTSQGRKGLRDGRGRERGKGRRGMEGEEKGEKRRGGEG